MTRAELERAHVFSSRNRDLVAASDRAGCFYCGATFAAGDIVDWVDGRQPETGDTADGITALCPRCGIDAVLPSAAAIPLSSELLASMHNYWFER